MVTNVRVEQLTETSVTVSWDAITLPEVIRYRVFYSQVESRKRQVMGELMVEVQGRDQTSVVIEDLVSSAQYQFQVVAIAVLGGMEFVGERSVVGDESLHTLTTTAATVSTTCKEGMVKLRKVLDFNRKVGSLVGMHRIFKGEEGGGGVAVMRAMARGSVQEGCVPPPAQTAAIESEQKLI